LIGFDVVLDRTGASGDRGAMAHWHEIEEAAPDLARVVRERFDALTNKTLATVRRDGAPRISGSEAKFARGELWIGSMWEARKAQDLRRDPRFALHSGSGEPPAWKGDAKVAGVAEEITDPELMAALNDGPPGPSHLFRLDLHEVSAVHVEDDELVIDVWTPARGVRTLRRR